MSVDWKGMRVVIIGAARQGTVLARYLAERGAWVTLNDQRTAAQLQTAQDSLADLPVDEATRWLTSFDGIGHKTASIVLLFCFNKPAFPVDTHVGRVTRRLGLAGPKDSEEKIKAIWESLAPAAWFYPLHLNLIRHGREVCHAQRPACGICRLEEICRYEQKNGGP
jgi:endonuclease-3